MFKVDSAGVVYLTRGDSASINVGLNTSAGAVYEMQPGDELKLTLKGAPKRGNEELMCITSATNNIQIAPADTKNLNIGQYSADIQLTTVDGHVYTVWPQFTDQSKLSGESNWRNFWITAEVSE